MKLLPLTLLLPLAFVAPTQAQQLNTYQVCHTYQEQYTPGYYTNNGSYIQGGVYTIKNIVNCQTGEVYSSQPYRGGRNVSYQQPYYRQRTCNPNNAAYGAAVGYGLATAISGQTGYNYNSNYRRNRNSGSYNYSYGNKRSNSWGIFGAGVGSILFGC
jgi:hypothetical protein